MIHSKLFVHLVFDWTWNHLSGVFIEVYSRPGWVSGKLFVGKTVAIRLFYYSGDYSCLDFSDFCEFFLVSDESYTRIVIWNQVKRLWRG